MSADDPNRKPLVRAWVQLAGERPPTWHAAARLPGESFGVGGVRTLCGRTVYSGVWPWEPGLSHNCRACERLACRYMGERSVSQVTRRCADCSRPAQVLRESGPDRADWVCASCDLCGALLCTSHYVPNDHGNCLCWSCSRTALTG